MQAEHSLSPCEYIYTYTDVCDGEPPSIENGLVNVRGVTAKYTCNKGYCMEDDEEITCSNKKWPSNTNVRCKCKSLICSC